MPTPHVIKAARRAVLLMTDEQLAAVGRELAKMPERAPRVAHDYLAHRANQSCAECVAEICEVVVRRMEGE